MKATGIKMVDLVPMTAQEAMEKGYINVLFCSTMG